MKKNACLIASFAFVTSAVLIVSYGTTIMPIFANLGVSTAITATTLVVITPLLALWSLVCASRHYLKTCPYKSSC